MSPIRRRLRFALAAAPLVVTALVIACAPRVIRAPHGAPPPMPLRTAFDGLVGGAGRSHVTSLDDNAEAWAARWELLASARETIDVAYFIIEDDVYGKAFLGHLYKRALDGVDVRILIDGRGSHRLLSPTDGRDYLQELVATGQVEIHAYNPPLGRAAAALMNLSAIPTVASVHDKILVIDTARAMVGGRNIEGRYFANPRIDPTATIDVDVVLDGEPAAMALKAKLVAEMNLGQQEEVGGELVNAVERRSELLLYYYAMDAWLRMPRDDPRTGVEAALALEIAALAPFEELPPREARDLVRADIHELVRELSLRGTISAPKGAKFEGEVHILAATSRARGFDYTINGAILQTMAGSQRDIVVQSPYFVLTKPALAALIELGARGVQVTVVTNSAVSSDNPASQALFIDEWPEIMARVPTLRLFVLSSERLLHAKRAIFDDDVTMVGTYNLDPLSARVNSEVVAAIWSRELASHGRAQIDALIHSGAVLEYRIERDDDGAAKRHPRGHPSAGKVQVAFGPEHHVPASTIAELRAMKVMLLAVAGLFDFEVALW